MNRLHYIQVGLLIAASLVFIIGLSYLNQAHTGGVGVIESFYFNTQEVESENTVAFSSLSQTSMEPLGLSITETRGVYLIIGISFFILASIIVTALTERNKTGRHTVQIPLVAASLLLMVTFLAQLLRFWLF